ncbi:Cyanate hydratase [Psilocybe cubensis]|uniref:Cyanate hydratase n=1 Tax=Psilocybe cubensis TaxID=181762 RepID=A0ACB8H286_PSICU|nr:Cyanate hydratase [Psilocybe cubensis]KAH9481807.1 Cyanate hydratase [Psilocybe cubensis]
MSSATPTVATNNSPYADLPAISSVLFEAKAKKGLTFDQIAKQIGRDEVWLAAAFYGQAKFTTEELKKVAEVLDISSASALSEIGDHWWPNRGLGPMPPQDPVIYRLYEGVLVYGHAIKAIIHEKVWLFEEFVMTTIHLHKQFGDGIMSMIDCKIDIEKKPDPKGDRVVLSFE